MRGLDDTDREIVDLLLEDGRRPYSEIADRVGLSPPAVSDRVDRLREVGLIERFTVDVDRSMLREGVPVLLDVTARPGTGAGVASALESVESVEHVFRTADERVVATATVPEDDASAPLDRVDDGDLRTYDVRLLAGAAWSPRIGDATLAPTCAECDNTVTAEGESARLDGDVYHFCCSSCRSQFVERYERLREGAE